ncbi:Leucine-rich repeat transmembrane protein flrt1 [Mactra antiquata]
MWLCGRLVLIITILVNDVTTQTGPSGCTWSDGVYTCDYSTMSSSDRPMDFTQFSDTPQHLVVENSGFFPYFGDTRAFSSEFSTSSGINITQLNENSPATLVLDCGRGGSIYISSGAFYDMEYIEHLTIRNCYILYIGTDTFNAFQQLDYFGIEGGSIDQLEVTAFSGLSVEPLSTSVRNIPRPHGKLDVRNTEFVSGVVDSAFVSYFSDISAITIRNAGLTALASSMFAYNTNVKIVDLSDNVFNKIPVGFLTSLNSLSEIILYNIPWECSCENLWWVETVTSNQIRVTFDGICNNVNGMSVFKYYEDNCAKTEVCDGVSGLAMGSNCVTILSLIIMILSVISCTATVVALVLAIMNLRDLGDYDGDDEEAEIDENVGGESSSNTIRNCITTYIGTDTFSAFVELDYFSLEGGSLDQMELTAMSGLSVKKLTSSTHKFPRQHGRVANNGISYVTTDQLQNNLLVKTIDLSDNIFVKLPSGIFQNLNGLSEVTLHNIPWQCKCGDLDWFGDVLDNNITIRGDLMCDNINGISVRKYYYDTCAASNVCDGVTGMYSKPCRTNKT